MNVKKHNKNKDGDMIHLRVFIDANGKECKISMEGGFTLEQYFTKEIDLSNIESLTEEIHSILDYSSRIGENGDKGFLKNLQEAGQQLYHSLLPLPIKEKISNTEAKHLSLIIDDSLIGIPWEIMHDGEEFLCLRFNMGRRIFTSHSQREKQDQKLDPQIKMLILANPTGDLPRSYEEGLELSEALKQLSESLDLYFKTKDITIANISRQLLDFDILHYAGHAVYNSDTPDLSGWCLKDGTFTAQKIMELSGGKRNFPSLIFSNACHSGQTTKWSILQPDEQKNPNAFDLVNAFLRCGVRHYIGTLKCITDPSSLDLALQFYNFILESNTIGESLRLARLRMIEKYGRDNLIWAHYVLYGNPVISYIKESVKEGDTIESKMSVCALNSKGSTLGQGIKTSATEDYFAQGIHGRQKGHVRNGSLVEGERAASEKDVFPIGKQKGKRRLRNGLLAGGLIILFLIILFAGTAIFVDRFMKPRDLKPEPSNINLFQKHDRIDNEDILWEEKKWEVVGRIRDRLRQRFSETGRINNSQIPSIPSNEKGSSLMASSGEELSSKSTICIIPEKPQGKPDNEEERITERTVKELYRFWIKQPEYLVVERDRLDFVMRELELATSSLSENKLRFAFGKIFGSMGILFVRVFVQPTTSSFFSQEQEIQIYLHYVDTETAVVKAIAEASIKDQDLRDISTHLGEEILNHLKGK